MTGKIPILNIVVMVQRRWYAEGQRSIKQTRGPYFNRIVSLIPYLEPMREIFKTLNKLRP